uniref:Uncharacterized protein n=1 Tax=Arundo donax TaxID=35708 RepID=A0A0A9ANI8_ARUDO
MIICRRKMNNIDLFCLYECALGYHRLIVLFRKKPRFNCDVCD